MAEVPRTMFGIPNPSNLALPKDDENLLDNLIELANCAETAERYHDSCYYLKVIVALKGDDYNNIQPMKQSDRNLLSAAFKNVVGALRTASRKLKEKISQCEDAARGEMDPDKRYPHELNIERNKVYIKMVNNKVIEKCREVVDLLVSCDDAHLKDAHRKIRIPALDKSNKTETNEEAVFYLKMKGDYFRYMAESDPKGEMKIKEEGEEKSYEYRALALKSYESAKVIAEELTETSPIRLGLALNHSVCLYEIMFRHQDAIDVAKEAFNKAIQKLDQLNDNTYKDSTLIMQLLRDNLALWQKEGEKKQPANVEPEED